MSGYQKEIKFTKNATNIAQGRMGAHCHKTKTIIKFLNGNNMPILHGLVQILTLEKTFGQF